MELKTPRNAQAESSSETHPTTTTTNNNNAKTKPLLHLKNCNSFHRHHHHQEMVVSYKECLKNHAASLGGHALDGCGEFMPSPTATPTEPTSLKCAACGCHRNFHRRDPYDGHGHGPTFIHHLPPPPPSNPGSSPSPTNSLSTSPTHTPPSPVPYSYYSSAPHMLLALSTSFSGPFDEYHHHHLNHSNPNNNSSPSGRKRSRTKFSKEQKQKMHAFAEKLGWRMSKSEEGSIERFCNEVGVDRGVFKVWMHNNKNTFAAKKDQILAVGNLNLDSHNNEDNGNGNNKGSIQLIHVSTNNGSSSAS